MCSRDAPIDLTVNSPVAQMNSLEVEADAVGAKRKKKISPLSAFLPPCRVCNALASGYHFGANTCEACKAFFRRSIGHEDAIKPCKRDKKCAQSPIGKILCTSCRHEKCLSVGMTKDGCRKGRYTYEKKTQDIKEFKRMQADKVINIGFEVQNCSGTVAMLTNLFEQNFISVCSHLDDKDAIDARVRNLVAVSDVECPLTRPLYSPGPALNSVHCSCSPSLVERLMQKVSMPEQVLCTPEQRDFSTSELMNLMFEAWAFRAENTFRNLTAFTKTLSGFSDLPINDRIILLKQGRLDALSVLMHGHFYLDLEAMCYYSYETGDLILMHRAFLSQVLGNELVEHSIRLLPRVTKLNFCKEDMAVLLAFVILTPDREGLQRADQVQRLQDKLLPVVQYTLRKNHPDQPSILPDTLLLMPRLRDGSEIHWRSVGKIRDRVSKESSPLFSEIIQE